MDNEQKLKLYKDQVCTYCELPFESQQGRCWTADWPDDHFHAHCMKLFREEMEALYHGDCQNSKDTHATIYPEVKEIPNAKPLQEVANTKKGTPLERHIYTKGKKANAQTI